MTVAICTFSEERWDHLVEAVRSLEAQQRPPDQLLVVVDHNAELAKRAGEAFPQVEVVESTGEGRGVAGTRNTAIEQSRCDIVAYLDDDAAARPDWLRELLTAYADDRVIGTGCTIQPAWESERPYWFPSEFDWVIGCSYRGQPEVTAPVRNVYANGMSFLRRCLEQTGAFRSDLGRVNSVPLGGEETEFCIRLRQAFPGSDLVHVATAEVTHRVPDSRLNFGYFLRRCYAEGLSKALVSRYVGSEKALATERDYTRRTLPRGVLAYTRAALGGRPREIARAGAIVAGLTVTVAGYVRGIIAGRGSPPLNDEKGSAHLGRSTRDEELSDHAGGKEMTGLAGTRPDRIERGGLLVDAGESRFWPVAQQTIELAGPIEDFVAEGAPERPVAFLGLVRLHGYPLGTVAFPLPENGVVAADEIVRRISEQLGDAVSDHLERDGLEPSELLGPKGLSVSETPPCSWRARLGGARPKVSIGIATCGSSLPLLFRTVRSALEQSYDDVQVVVIDNRPGRSALPGALFEAFPGEGRLKYVTEEKPGLAAVRNKTMRSSDGEFVALTDDDVLLDPDWAAFLVAGFERPEVACVTGLIYPSQLETQAQVLIERFGGFTKGFSRRTWDIGPNRLDHPLYPYLLGIYGSGANAAWRRSSLADLGGYDERLGTGTLARGGEDLDIYLTCIRRGYQIVYEPGAIVFHQHRREMDDLRTQIFDYGVGLGAVLTKRFLEKEERREMLRRLPAGLRYLLHPSSPKNSGKTEQFPKSLTLTELAGIALGPIAYMRSRRCS